jgi:cytoskeletal protein RodZ
MKSRIKEQGSVLHIAIVVLLVLALLGALGFIFWQNFINKEPVKTQTQDVSKNTESTTTPSTYTLKDAITGINSTLSQKACTGAGAQIASGDVKKAEDSDKYVYVGGQSVVDSSYSYAYLQYGCGSSGSGAWMKRTDKTWSTVDVSASIYPLCANIRGQGFPGSVVAKCYPDSNGSSEVDI